MTAVPPRTDAAPGRWRRLLAEQIGKRRAAVGSLAALSLKVAGTVLMMGIFFLAARSMSPMGFGHLAVSFNALSFLAVVAVLGQDLLMVRCWGEYATTGAHGLALGAYRFSGSVVVVSALGFAALTFAVAVLNPFLHVPPGEAAAAAAFLAMQVLLLFTAQTTRVILNFLVSETNRELTWRLVVLPVVFAGLWLGLDLTAFYAAAAAGLALAVAIQLAVVRRRFPAAVGAAESAVLPREWASRAGGMWVSAILEAAQQYAEVLMLGLLVSPDVAGLYFLAARIAGIFGMVGSGLHGYTSSHAANLFFTGQMAALQNVFRSVMAVAALITVPLLAVVLLGGGHILAVFGPHYSGGAPVLAALALGSFAAALAGPANSLLLVTGHERLYSRVLFVALLVRVALIAWAAPRFGAFGVAAAWAGVNGPVAIGLAIATRHLTGIDPSVLCTVMKREPRRRPQDTGPRLAAP